MSPLGIQECSSFLKLCPHSAAGQQCLIRCKPENTPDGTMYLPQEEKCSKHNKHVTKEQMDWLTPAKKEAYPWSSGKNFIMLAQLKLSKI